MTNLTTAQLYHEADVTRREIEGYKITQNEVARGEAESHLAKIQEEIERRKQG